MGKDGANSKVGAIRLSDLCKIQSIEQKVNRVSIGFWPHRVWFPRGCSKVVCSAGICPTALSATGGKVFELFTRILLKPGRLFCLAFREPLAKVRRCAVDMDGRDV